MQTCAHCHKPIGQLEPMYAWNDQVICADCQRTLSGGVVRTPIIQPIHVVVRTPAVQTIQLTSKFWKVQIALALLMMLIGGWLSGVSLYRILLTPAVPHQLPLGAVIFILGIVWLIVARAGAWWDHG